MSGIPGELDVASTSYLLNPFEGRDPAMGKKIREDPTILRSEWKGTSIVYSTERIMRADVE